MYSLLLLIKIFLILLLFESINFMHYLFFKQENAGFEKTDRCCLKSLESSLLPLKIKLKSEARSKQNHGD